MTRAGGVVLPGFDGRYVEVCVELSACWGGFVFFKCFRRFHARENSIFWAHWAKERGAFGKTTHVCMTRQTFVAI